jgi:hypothetical protein
VYEELRGVRRSTGYVIQGTVYMRRRQTTYNIYNNNNNNNNNNKNNIIISYLRDVLAPLPLWAKKTAINRLL